jgi:glycosyl-4,4'-diaponeurosporenoate acyltransferase
MSGLIWVANILGWPVVHLAIGFASVHLPSELFAHDSWLTAPRNWEDGGRLYRDWIGVRRWKSLLPDGAPWFGGFAKKRLTARGTEYLHHFILETRRAETAHWCMLCCLPLFFLWNPPWACWVMTMYAVAANLPCILVQRYNRIALYRMALRGRRVIVQS